MAKPASEIWRKYVTDGVPASGVNNPVKDDIREWSVEVEQNIAALEADDTSVADEIAAIVAVNATQDERLDVLEDGASGSLVVKPTWTALSTVIGSFDGQAAEVPSSDAGTHTDPVVGGTVANAGRYSWVASTPSGWQWISADTLTGKADKTTTITGGGLATGGGDLSANRVITVPKATPAEASAGVLDDKAVTPLGLLSAIDNNIGISSEYAELAALVNARKWPASPSFSALAVPEKRGPLNMSFTRASTAYRVNGQGELESVASGVLRHDYDPSSGLYRGWLLEPAKTNVCRHSNGFDVGLGSNGWGSAGVSRTPASGVAPDGTTTAYLISESGALEAHHFTKTESAIAPSVEQTWSIWLKYESRRYVRLTLADNDSPTNNCIVGVDILSGQLTDSVNAGNAVGARGGVESYTDGWFRVWITGTPNTSGSNTRFRVNLMISDEPHTGTTTYGGDGSSGMYAWGAQGELGVVPTSYIPTTTTSVTRAADVLSAGVGTWFNNARGGLYVDFTSPSVEEVSDEYVVASIDDQTTDNAFQVVIDGGQVKFRVRDGGADVTEVFASSEMSDIGSIRFLGLWEESAVGAVLSVGAVSLAALAETPTVTHLRIAPALPIRLFHAAVFPRRIADSDARVVVAPDAEGWLDDPDRLAAVVTRDKFVLSEYRASDGTFLYVGQESGQKFPEVENVFIGAITDTSLQYAYDIKDGDVDMDVRERITTDEDGINVVTTTSLETPTARTSLFPYPYIMRKGEFTGLTPNTTYYLWAEFGGTWHNFGQAKTFPVTGTPAALKFVCSSCQRPKKQTEYSSTYVSMREEDALLHVQLGDLHYANIAVDNLAYWRRATRFILGHQDMGPTFRVLPMAYMPDDHDTGPNNFQLNKVYPGIASRQIVLNMQTVYDEYPHYDLVHPGASYPSNDTVLTQEWPSAHIWNILVDSRSQRELREPHNPATPDMDGTILGDGVKPVGSWDQVSGLKDMLLAAGAAGYYAVALWFPVMWHKLLNGNPIPEGWWSCAGQEAIDFQEWLRDTPGIPQVYLFTGDNHNKGSDDGRLTDITPDGGLSVPQFLCSAAHHRSNAGFPNMRWISGTLQVFHNDRGYGLIEFDTDGHITVTLKGAPEPEPRVYDLISPLEVIGTYSSTDVTPAVRFSQTSMNASASSTVQIPFQKSWFGPPGPVDGNGGTATVDYTTNEGSPQTGVISIRPNCGKYVLELPTPASGSFTVTLSNPSDGVVLAAPTSCVITIV